jgi:mannose-1-phosphate guanylyltransferase
VARHRPADAAGNRTRGDVALVEARDCVVEGEEGLVALLGVSDLIVVRTRDAVLVAPRGRAEEVRKVVEALAARGRKDLL